MFAKPAAWRVFYCLRVNATQKNNRQQAGGFKPFGLTGLSG
ncbi:hypothetical protein BN137_4269 [Cronobacter condimenti 1330]|uniref:Uncharacterized protein n=1 Tax=Cronobacter condimenti 1330 TaxID=1073999 RepID=K8A421_9ENTR|nr:hypothetical protein BN137_4269 [Cronobacter condimenti 1330]